MRNGAHHAVVRAVPIAAAAALTLGLAGCGSGESAAAPAQDGALVLCDTEIADAELWSAAQEEGGFTLYTAQPEATSQAIVEAFMEATGLDVESIRLSGGPLAERVLSEVAGDQLAADVIQASDVQFAEQLKEVDALQPYTVPWIDDLNPDLIDPDSMYTPWSTAVMALAYNSALVEADEVPQSWDDLLDPRWKDRIGIFDIGTGGSAWVVALFQRQVLGEDYWADLAAQNPAVFSGNAPLAESLTRGEIEVGTASPGVILRAKREGAPVDVVFPSEGFPAFVSFLTIPKSAENVNAAKVYLNWATSECGENEIKSISGDYMSNTKVSAPSIDDTEMPESGPWVPSTEDWLDLRDAWSREYRQVFGEAAN